MKKITLLALFSLFLLNSFMGPARALEISAGPMAWYAWWSPYFKNYFQNRYSNRIKALHYMEYGEIYLRSRWKESGSFLYGPAVSVKVSDEWSFSSVFTMGSPYGQTGGSMKLYPGPDIISQNVSLRMKKYDSDTTVNYSPLPYLKIFCGFKYQGYSYSSRPLKTFLTSAPTAADFWLYNYTAESDGYGAGLGLGTVLPVAEDLYLLGNLSGVYMRSYVDWNEKAFSPLSLNAFMNRQNQKFNAAGMNGSLSLAYYITAASVTVSAGFRFQMLKMYCSRLVHSYYDSTYNVFTMLIQNKILGYSGRDVFNGTTDYFYGVVLSVTYNFKI
ncbi:MAG: hypothetical protein MUD12_11285 [Spirochaetes bacterium]|jgi:hypothetical protein|nr:hypothetical protein [Spirochaetota bacterium]